MGAAFRLPGVDIEALKAQWQAQLSKLPGFSPDLFQSWVQQSPMAGLNVPGLKPVQQAVDAVSHSVSDDLQSLAGLKVDPDTLKTIQSEYLQRATELWNQALTKPEALTVKDRRFAAPEWSQSPASAFTASMYLLNAQTMQRLADSLTGVEKARERVRFAVQQWSAAMSPSNFLALNPEALKKAVETKGESIQHGIQHLLGDIRQGHLSMTDESVFEVGKNVATTAGTVVFENAYFQLIEYTPITAKVHATPFLFVPPCINKYYILDLQPDNSVVRHLLSEGHRVFMVSWVNADESLAQATWDDYIEQGVIQAIETTREIANVDQINALGFCVGGTLMATALSVLVLNATPGVDLVFVVGRTLQCGPRTGLAGAADVILLPELAYDVDAVAAVCREREQHQRFTLQVGPAHLAFACQPVAGLGILSHIQPAMYFSGSVPSKLLVYIWMSA